MTRHASLAEQLSAIKAFANRPEAIETLQTNWTQVAANDNNPEDYVDVHVERRISIRPTMQEIVRSIDSKDIEKNESGQIIRIGNLRFSDGTQMERCMMAGIDGDPIVGVARMPTGAMLGTKEDQERPLGGSGGPEGESNRWFCELFDVHNRQYVPGGKRRKGRNYTREESVAMLVTAIANTPTMPVVYQCEDGVALGASRISDNFIGMKKAPKGNGGSVAWQDLSDKLAEREMYIKAERELDEDDKVVVQAASSAKTFSGIGACLGYTGKAAERRGKRALIAANGNLMAAIKKLSV